MNKLLGKQDTLDKKLLENLQVLFALMALCGKSDREIARILEISNTTLSRRRRKLEQDGYIKEYTIIPDLHKMGLEVIVFSFSSTTDVVTPVQSKEAHDLIQKYPEILCILQDQGLEGTNWLGITVHKNYDGFIDLSKKVQNELLSLHQPPHIETHTFMFHTDKMFPKPFSFRNMESLFQSVKPLHGVKNKRDGKTINPIDA